MLFKIVLKRKYELGVYCLMDLKRRLKRKIYFSFKVQKERYDNSKNNKRMAKNKYLVANNSANLSKGRIGIVLRNLRSHFT